MLLWMLVVPDVDDDSGAWLLRVGTAYLAVIGGLAVGIGGMVVWRGSVIHRWLRWALAGIVFLAADIALSVAAQPSGEHVGLRLVGMSAGLLASTCIAVAALRREAVAAAMQTMLPNGPAVTVSIGVVEVEPEAMSTPAVIESADAALYAAKSAGGDCVVLGEPSTVSSSRPTR